MKILPLHGKRSYFKMKKISIFLKSYLDQLSKKLLAVDNKNLNFAAEEILKTIKRKKLTNKIHLNQKFIIILSHMK